MPRVTLDIDDKFDQTLSALADGSSRADVIRRAVASYQYLNAALANGDPGTRLALTDAAGHIQKNIVLPSSGTGIHPIEPAGGTLTPVNEEQAIGKRPVDHTGVRSESLTVEQPGVDLPGAAQPHLQHRPETQAVLVSSNNVGSVEIAPPSFLERWGVIFLAGFSLWIILTGSVILLYFLRNQPPPPNLTGLSADGLRDALTAHKQLVDQWRDSLEYIFDLLITKTALPLVTLLLGYLFGKGQVGSSK